MAKVMIVPGLAVRDYADPAVRVLQHRGHDAELLDPPGWRGSDCDLGLYGRHLADRIDADGLTVDVLVGLSVGTQAAAVAAAESTCVERLLLVSPTVDPAARTRGRLLRAWLLGKEVGGPSLWTQQVPDWSRAGVGRIYAGFSSAVELLLEDVLPDVSAEVTLVHGELDPITSHHYVARLAADHDCRLLLLANGTHSWPMRDEQKFAGLIEELTAS